jgi:energy-coupling factor transporter transmembrane protein EcfT
MHIASSPPPLLRGFATALVLCGAIQTDCVPLLAVGQAVAVGTLLRQRCLRSFARFALSIILPMGLGLIVVWGFIRQGGPSQRPGESIQGGVLFAITTTMRLALLGAAFQAAFLSLPPPKLVHLLQAFSIRGRALATVVCSLNLWPDFKRQVEQVVAARCARSLMPDRRLVSRVRQVPYVIRTLFVSALARALERAAAWESSGLLDRLDQLGHRVDMKNDYSWMAGVGWLGLSLLWTILAIRC